MLIFKLSKIFFLLSDLSIINLKSNLNKVFDIKITDTLLPTINNAVMIGKRKNRDILVGRMQCEESSETKVQNERRVEGKNVVQNDEKPHCSVLKEWSGVITRLLSHHSHYQRLFEPMSALILMVRLTEQRKSCLLGFATDSPRGQ